MFDIILWDIDGTLLDFLAAERAAIRHLFDVYGLGPCSDEMIAGYSAINKAYWRRMEDGQITKPEVLVGRFRDFFAGEGLMVDVERFNREYQVCLGDTIVFIDRGYELLCELKAAGIRQYAVTNGTALAQHKKLKNSRLCDVFDGVFISDEVGYEKPHPAFFAHVWQEIGNPARERVLLVGDSLSSDIRGASNAGIAACWYNPRGEKLPPDLTVVADIQNLWQVKSLLGGSRKEK